jgi:hypothetical protein
MPIHDWNRMPAGLFHDFHQTWTIQLKAVLNGGVLPKGFSALIEQKSKDWQRWEPDVLAVEDWNKPRPEKDNSAATLILDPPKTRLVFRSEEHYYADRANRIVIKHHLGRTLAVIELVSPGNKDSRPRIRSFVDKVVEFIRQGVHVLIVDLFPPSKRDPEGIHRLIWDEIKEEPFVIPPGKDRVLASYEAGPDTTAWVELASVDLLPSMPLFLAVGKHVQVPLEKSYQMAWDVCPEGMREAVESGVLPEVQDE